MAARGVHPDDDCQTHRGAIAPQNTVPIPIRSDRVLAVAHSVGEVG